MILDIVKVLLPATLGFFVGMGITPTIANYLYKNKMWKKTVKSVAVDGHATPVFSALHKDREVNTPRLGGVIIWLSAFISGSLIWVLAKFTTFEVFTKIEFISRNQTWIPFATLLIGAFVGLIDDILEIKGSGGHIAGGLSLKKRLLAVGAIGLIIGSWFFFKLDVVSIGIPFYGDLFIGWLIIPLFIVVLMAIYSGGVIDGIDGLAGGVFTIMFAAYGLIAFYLDLIDLAAFSALIVGSILAFLWYNIPPARFYMSETGSMALTVTLGVIAFMTDSLGGGFGILLLLIIGMPLIITTGSVIINVTSKKFRNGKKVFLSTPIHHHFEALGWPPYKVTMRYWVGSVIFAALGVIIALIG